MALQTVEPKNLQQITLQLDASTVVGTTREMVHQEWQDLDRLLV
jgi:hypothetical protein